MTCRHAIYCVLACGFMLGLRPALAHADVVYTDSASFLANVSPGFYLETFNGLPKFTPILSPIPFTNGMFSYQASAPTFFYTVGPGTDVWLSTSGSQDTITMTFTSGNVTAVGGNFFPENAAGDVTPGTINLVLSTGTMVSLTNPTNTTFRGFTTDVPITSLQIQEPTFPTYATVNDFYVGTAAVAVPEPSSIVLGALASAALGIGWIGRRRKGQQVATV